MDEPVRALAAVLLPLEQIDLPAPVGAEDAGVVVGHVGLPYVFNEQVDVPGFGSTRALCAYQKGTLGPAANGQKWNFKSEANSSSLKVLLTYIYSCTYGNFTDAGDAVGLEHWSQYWSDIWFLVAQAMSWYYEHGIIIDVNSNKEGFIEQTAEEFVAAMKLYHETYGQSSWITDWNKIGTHSIIDSSDGGKTGYSAYDYIATGVNMVLEQLFLTFTLGVGINVPGMPFAVRPLGRIPPLPKMVVDLRHTASSGLPLLALVGLKSGPWAHFMCLGG